MAPCVFCGTVNAQAFLRRCNAKKRLVVQCYAREFRHSNTVAASWLLSTYPPDFCFVFSKRVEPAVSAVRTSQTRDVSNFRRSQLANASEKWATNPLNLNACMEGFFGYVSQTPRGGNYVPGIGVPNKGLNLPMYITTK